MNGDEHMLDGGLYAPDGQRTDVYLKESGPGINEAAGEPMTFDLVFVTGNGTFTLTECAPADVERLGQWFKDMGTQFAQPMTIPDVW